MDKTSLTNLENLIGKIGDNFSIISLTSPEINAFGEPNLKINIWGTGYSITANNGDNTFDVGVFTDTDLETISPLTPDEVIGLIAEKSHDTMLEIYSDRRASKHNVLM